MLIHKTHSKKNLRELFMSLDYDFNNNLNKKELVKKIDELIQSKKMIYKENNNYDIKHKTDLLEYLKKPNYNEKISLEKKNEVMKRAKRIIQWGKHNYNFFDSFYDTIEQVYADAIYISPYGFLPTIRRACNIHNQSFNKVDHVNPTIPKRILQEMEEKKIVKKCQFYNLTITQGPHIIVFD